MDCYQAIDKNNEIVDKDDEFKEMKPASTNYFMSKENILTKPQADDLAMEIENIKLSLGEKGQSIQLDFPKLSCTSCGKLNDQINSKCLNCRNPFESVCGLTGLSINSSISTTKCSLCSQAFIFEYLDEYLGEFDFCPVCLGQLVNT